MHGHLIELPDLDRTVETFFPLDSDRHTPSDDAMRAAYNEASDRGWRILGADYRWFQRVIGVLREEVAPVVYELMSSGLINWYGILMHDKECVPCPRDDDRIFVHLRIALAPGRDLEELKSALPASALWPQWSVPPNPPELGKVHLQDLIDGDPRWAWWLFGLGSTQLLGLACAHSPGVPVSPDTVATLIHYGVNGGQWPSIGSDQIMARGRDSPRFGPDRGNPTEVLRQSAWSLPPNERRRLAGLILQDLS